MVVVVVGGRVVVVTLVVVVALEAFTFFLGELPATYATAAMRTMATTAGTRDERKYQLIVSPRARSRLKP
jgi:hypothetical protein